MANFNQAHKFVAKSEGGYSGDPDDRGNWVDGVLVGTNWGISAPVLKTYYGKTPTKNEMKSLPESTAVKIYKRNYWDAINGDKIKNQSLALLLYDSSVNQGNGAITKMVKDSLKNQNRGFTSFNADGIKQINNSNQKKLFSDVWKERYKRYVRGQAKYVKGWISRIKKIAFKSEKGKWIGISILGLSAIVGGYYIYQGLKK